MKKILFIILMFAIIYSQTNETNKTYTSTDKNQSIITNIEIKNFTDNFKSLIPNIKIAIVIDNKSKKYVYDIMNNLATYFLYKKTNFSLNLYSKKDFNENLMKRYKYIIVYTLDKNIPQPPEDTYLFYPIINKNDVNYSSNNVYFAGIDFVQQIQKLSTLLTEKKAIAINENTYFSKKLLKIEQQELNITSINVNDIIYYQLKNKYIFFNTSSVNTAKILSKLNYLNLPTYLQLAPQINYDPMLIELTQPSAVNKLIIANSIINFPKNLEDFNENLYTNIKFNWLNYASSLLANKIYNLQTNSEEFFLNDFGLYIFDNQVNYKTNLYQIINGGFQKIY